VLLIASTLSLEIRQMPNLDGAPKKTALLGNQAAALSSRFASSGAGQNKFM
jgi:hypothetical protein